MTARLSITGISPRLPVPGVNARRGQSFYGIIGAEHPALEEACTASRSSRLSGPAPFSGTKRATALFEAGSPTEVQSTMSSETLHAPRERLTKATLSLHHAIVSLMEELEAVDWYRQRADDAEDDALREILLHNMREEMEHASMVLEWIRRNNPDFDGFLKTYLFTKAPITQVEKAAEGKDDAAPASGARPSGSGGFTIGTLKDKKD
jgi:ferritin-like protein